jgi:NAD(P)H-hydrate epimerase
MTEDFGIELIQMMENAGRHLANLARKLFLRRDAAGKQVIALAGAGGNGGGAMAAARRLHGWGAEVAVFLARAPGEIGGVPGHQLASLRRLGIPISDGLPGERATDAAVELDGILGYGVSGEPRGGAAALIHWANHTGLPILALDVPSGLDSTRGAVYEPVIRAAATLTLALPKKGLREAVAAGAVGALFLADIGVPASAYARLGLQVRPVFARSEILRLR